jgi:hypothetical protein
MGSNNQYGFGAPQGFVAAGQALCGSLDVQKSAIAGVFGSLQDMGSSGKAVQEFYDSKNNTQSVGALERHLICLSNWIDELRMLGARAEAIANTHLGAEPEPNQVFAPSSQPPDSTMAKLLLLEESLAAAVGKITYQIERLSKL